MSGNVPGSGQSSSPLNSLQLGTRSAVFHGEPCRVLTLEVLTRRMNHDLERVSRCPTVRCVEPFDGKLIRAPRGASSLRGAPPRSCRSLRESSDVELVAIAMVAVNVCRSCRGVTMRRMTLRFSATDSDPIGAGLLRSACCMPGLLRRWTTPRGSIDRRAARRGHCSAV